ncbi:hypothetical protein M419DRAFT_120969 [Trichoderma reesei RUT C-30]|uniref:Uncharacterized protein n=1 Tax=Hypocrea jecorina (strain ATCC 56765 / BCRC 32924 / NRRL 11460 / Rut C-30) TaxID=1344414 RepID=A0A024S0I3_HYPJR|nr:hypothetical protein M419DRAFT_120969 [Trichoderma reesei RUT C-30]
MKPHAIIPQRQVQRQSVVFLLGFSCPPSAGRCSSLAQGRCAARKNRVDRAVVLVSSFQCFSLRALLHLSAALPTYKHAQAKRWITPDLMLLC